jgi:hypothetical protein
VLKDGQIIWLKLDNFNIVTVMLMATLLAKTSIGLQENKTAEKLLILGMIKLKTTTMKMEKAVGRNVGISLK